MAPYKGYTRKQGEAVDRYMKANYDQVLVRDKKGFKEEVQNHAALTGESTNAFILRAIRETMERDKADITKMMRARRNTD